MEDIVESTRINPEIGKFLRYMGEKLKENDVDDIEIVLTDGDEAMSLTLVSTEYFEMLQTYISTIPKH